MSHLVFLFFPRLGSDGGRDTHTGGLVWFVFTLLVRAVTGLEGMVGDVACVYVWTRLLSPQRGGYLPLVGGAQTWSLGFSFFWFSYVRSYRVERWVVQREGNRIKGSTPPSAEPCIKKNFIALLYMGCPQTLPPSKLGYRNPFFFCEGGVVFILSFLYLLRSASSPLIPPKLSLHHKKVR